MRRPLTLALLAFAVALPVGCGDDSGEATTSGPLDAAASAREVRSAWEGDPSCARPRGASRWGCSVGAYRCQAAVTDRGWSVSCARPGRSIAFRVPPRR
jgi:hypothetical protein